MGTRDQTVCGPVVHQEAASPSCFKEQPLSTLTRDGSADPLGSQQEVLAASSSAAAQTSAHWPTVILATILLPKKTAAVYNWQMGILREGGRGFFC